LLKKPVQGFLLPFPTEPHRFSGLQITHPGEKLLALTQIDFIHPHLPQSRLPPSRRPALEIAHIEGPHRPLRQMERTRHPPYRCTLTSLPHRFCEPFAEGSLAGQQFHLFCLHPTTRTIHSVQLDHHRYRILAPGQIAHLSLIDLADVLHALPTSPTSQLLVAGFPSYPQLQRLGLLVDFMFVDPIAGPS
jgi:hypothetical protein